MIAQQEALVRQLAIEGKLPAAWQTPFRTVPRHRFIPPLIWDDTGEDLVPVSREDDPDRWLSLVYRDEAVITQVEDGRDLHGEDPWLKSSSSSAPSVVAMMLDRLGAEIHHRVLEVGTGTGWNAALLAARLGDEQVVTMEVDPAVAGAARKALAEAGLSPAVVIGDGTLGCPVGAPFDRVLCTAAVRSVPYAWLAQSRPGGRIVTPWGTRYDNGALLQLRVHADGSASGRFADWEAFMWLRADRTTRAVVEDVVDDGHDYDESATMLHPWEPLGDPECKFAVGLRVPACEGVVVPDEDGQQGHYVAFLLDPDGGSWASVHVEPGVIDGLPVRQHGPRRLWDEVGAAHAWWVSAGRPDHTRFGVTVLPGRQWTWLDTAAAPVGA